jgi:hypothetical protein
MSLRWELLEEEDAEGNVFPAHHATCYCSEQGTDSFHIFQPAHVDHFHLQCTTCGQSYCTKASCINNVQPHGGAMVNAQVTG